MHMRRLSNSRSNIYQIRLNKCLVVIACLSSYDNKFGNPKAMVSRGIISNDIVVVSSMHDAWSIL